MEKDMKKLDLKVGGMTCASCVNRIETSLMKAEGVLKANINLAKESASIDFDPTSISSNDIANVISNAGYQAIEDEVVLVVEGMTCASCVQKTENALLGVEGVVGASVNLATSQASVKFLKGAVETKDLIKAVEKVGYIASLKDEQVKDREKEARVKEMKKQRFLFYFALIFTIPVGIGGFSMLYPLNLFVPDFMGTKLFMFAFTTPIMFVSGSQFFYRTIKGLRHLSVDMNTLIASGTGAAYIMSTLITFFDLGPGYEAAYFDTAAFLITFILLGRMLEAVAKGKTSDAIRQLIGLQPKTAMVLRNGEEIEVLVEEVEVGDIVVVRPGE